MEDENQSSDVAAQFAKPKPEGFNELSFRAIIVAIFVAALMGSAYPYVVLKLGFGPNVSVVGAIFGFIILGLIVPGVAKIFGFQYSAYNRWENNIVQTGGTAAAQTAFMCILLAAFDMLKINNIVHLDIEMTRLNSFAWLCTAGLLGVLMAVPLRRHYIVDEKLPFPDGIAAGQTILVCDGEGKIARRAALAMVLGLIASAVLTLFKEDGHIFTKKSPFFVSGVFFTGSALLTLMRVGIEKSFLTLGSGMLIGMRINTSMLIGTLLAWVVAPYALPRAGFVKESFIRDDILFWVMWPATGMMIAGGLTALFMRWRVLAKTFKNLSVSKSSVDEFPISWVIVGILLSGFGLVVVQKFMLGQAIWITLVAIALSLPMALVGLRVLGETNWGPISALSNMMQGIFAFLAPGNVAANMIASGTTGTIAVESEAIMQDFKAGDMVGSSPKKLTIMQLIATPIGAAAVALVYPMLRDTYKIGGDGLSSPISQKWARFAEVLSTGVSALPKGAIGALIIASLLGVLLAILEITMKNKTWIPSPTGLGIGMLIPAWSIITMFLGGLVGLAWTRLDRKSSELYLTPLASGFIAGEAIIAVIIPPLILAHILE